jgi:class 3 adenylate cyclase
VSVTVCAQCAADLADSSKFCSECGTPVADAPAPTEQRRTVTALFCDPSGSTALGESVDPEALRAMLARHYEQMRVIVERHGGSVEKFIGDALTLSWLRIQARPGRTTPVGVS